MDTLSVVVDPARARCTRGGNVCAEIMLLAAGKAFPTESWTDFAVVLLSWWVPAIARVAADGRREELRFMEGPYWAEVWCDASGAWRADLVEHRRRQEVLRTLEFDVVKFAHSLMDAADVTLRLCRERDSWSSDADLLDASAKEFRRDTTLMPRSM
ncbi:MAG: hypothetical protein JO257_13360 [Deltaproteobacteria bacterium]|nr:hypothetical protein [Deltaproteobacteria bacterium]